MKTREMVRRNRDKPHIAEDSADRVLGVVAAIGDLVAAISDCQSDPGRLAGLHQIRNVGLPRGKAALQLVVGDLLASVNQPITSTISESPTFAGASAQCYGNGCTSHPSAGPPGASWLTDFFCWGGGYADN